MADNFIHRMDDIERQFGSGAETQLLTEMRHTESRLKEGTSHPKVANLESGAMTPTPNRVSIISKTQMVSANS